MAVAAGDTDALLGGADCSGRIVQCDFDGEAVKDAEALTRERRPRSRPGVEGADATFELDGVALPVEHAARSIEPGRHRRSSVILFAGRQLARDVRRECSGDELGTEVGEPPFERRPVFMRFYPDSFLRNDRSVVELRVEDDQGHAGLVLTS